MWIWRVTSESFIVRKGNARLNSSLAGGVGRRRKRKKKNVIRKSKLCPNSL